MSRAASFPIGVGLGFGFGLLLVAGTVPAQEPARTFGARGQIAISAERLLGFYSTDSETELDGTLTSAVGSATFTEDSTTDGAAFVVLGNDEAAGPAAIPRAAVDFFVIDGLSLGGALMFKSNSEEGRTEGTQTIAGNTNQADPIDAETDTTTFGISPRAGYAHLFTPTVGIWARGGITYLSRSVESIEKETDSGTGEIQRADTEVSISHVSLGLEGLLVLIPVDHIAFGVGPFVDLPLSGDLERKVTFTSPGNPTLTSDGQGDVKVTSFGVTSAIIAFF